MTVSLRRAPGVRVLTEQRIQVERHVFGGKLLSELCRRRGQLAGVWHDVLFLDQAVLVRDAERIEKCAHHRALRSQVIDDQRAGGEPPRGGCTMLARCRALRSTSSAMTLLGRNFFCCAMSITAWI